MKAGASHSRGIETIHWAGETLTLLPERAVWWAGEKTVFIADPHFGKASSFRLAGIPVPESSHHDDLARLERIVKENGAGTLVILGDFFHAKTGRSEATLSALEAWRGRHDGLKIVLVAGNHDRHSGAPPAEWEIECVKGPWKLPPFVCCHEPQKIAGQHVLAGHVHPSFCPSEKNGADFKAPCFYFGKRQAILPAFGSFTGTHRIEAVGPTDAVFMVGRGEVIDVSKLAVRRFAK